MKKTADKSRREFILSTALGALIAVRDIGVARTDSINSSDAFLRSGNLTAIVSEHGNSVILLSSKIRRIVTLEAGIDGYSQVGKPIIHSLRNGILEIQRDVKQLTSGERCTLHERFSADNYGSIHWEVDVESVGVSRTAPIHMIARYPATQDTRFWTAWSDPSYFGNLSVEASQWKDPLTLMPLAKKHLYYGAPYFTYDEPKIGFVPVYRNLMAIPIASFLEPKNDLGFSMALSPDAGDGLLDLTLDTNEEGSADFTFHYHRLNSDHAVRLAADIVSHEADWRGGLRWMTNRYPRYFNPKLKVAQELDGGAAYSTDGNTNFDAEKLRKMSFRTNWKASFDFPYMGMFLPPVKNEAWARFSGDSGGTQAPGIRNKNGYISIEQMADYSEKMRALRFHVLNYFNVAEFGANITYPPPRRVAKLDSDLWKNADDFLYGRLSNAIMFVPDGIPQRALKFYPGTAVDGPYYTWGNGVILDCGEPEYEQFLLQQAQRHIERLPASSGICIDRMDWLRLYNDRRDDGISWLASKPVRSLYVSWRRLMTKLLPMMHEAGKVVFVNNGVKRIDLLLDIDGIYDEFAMNGGSLNLTALLGVSRPTLGWTNDEGSIRDDPDGFFQRFLYMGVFPTVPFPGNDHSIVPSAWADRRYLEYGPLLNAMHGRKWVLEAFAVLAVNGEALVNVFSVPDGYAIPVVLGGDRRSAKVSMLNFSGLKRFKAEALHPTDSDPVPLTWSFADNRIVFDVPLVRGCAMVRIQNLNE